MSVLSFPRIYFKGFLGWDPCTFNNNDWQAFPTFDGANAALNWTFLATQGITQQNFYTTFRPWAIKLQPDNVDNPTGVRVPAEWNMFGGHGVSFVQYNDFTTTIIGGALGAGNPVTSDPLIGGPVALNGDGGGGPGRLVDTNPASFWSSQIYFGQLSFGNSNCMISGPRNFRLHSRWLDLNRIYTTDQELTQPAASVGACFQTCIPFDQVTWPAPSAGSSLASALQQAASAAQGIMVRFTAYVNLYFRNGIFNGTTQQPRNYTDLAALLDAARTEWNNTGKTDLFFSNPCYSHVVGTLGVWNAGEVASVPVGRYLSANSQVAAIATSAPVPTAAQAKPMGHHVMMMTANATPAAASPPPQVTLGPVVANIDNDAQLISLDLNSTMPENGTPGEWPSDLSKANFGALTLGVVAGGNFTPVVEIPYDQYAQAAYEASAGIIDIAFPNANTASLLQSGSLAIQVQGQTALLEEELTAQTDSRGIYVDEGTSAELEIAVYNFGAISPNTTVMVAQYDANLSLIPTDGAPLVAFTNGNQQTLMSGGTTTAVTIVTSDENGLATAGIEWVAPGFAVLAFFPYFGAMLPGPPISLLGPCATINGSITYAFYTTVRALPADNAAPQQFVDLWNSTGDQTQAWNFVYNEILYVYDMIFNVMLEFVNLGSQSAFAQNISSIWQVISVELAEESSHAMPITRDLSAGKRLVLQLYIYLIANNYNVPNFNVNSIPPDWSPPQ
ncbi:MAG TPA: hypothetical protein VNA69_13960 [Thermoanaerobaculia bacterium]|nr:hypothetical protein [Thermoanaerobaculia bacterium]